MLQDMKIIVKVIDTVIMRLIIDWSVSDERQDMFIDRSTWRAVTTHFLEPVSGKVPTAEIDWPTDILLLRVAYKESNCQILEAYK